MNELHRQARQLYEVSKEGGDMQVDAEGMSQPLLIQQLNTPGQHSGLCLNTHEDITTARARDTGHGYTGRLSKKLILFYTLTQGQLNYTSLQSFVTAEPGWWVLRVCVWVGSYSPRAV